MFVRRMSRWKNEVRFGLVLVVFSFVCFVFMWACSVVF